MNFPQVGTTIQSMLTMQKLTMKWQERQKDPTKPKGDEAAESSELRRLKEITENARKSSYVGAIRTRLQCGGDLTPEELDYIKVNHPDLYQSAMEARQERARYKRELENCRTQEEVDRLHVNRINGCLAQAKSALSNSNIPSDKKMMLLEKINAKLMGIKTEHSKFIKSGRYDSLPSEEEEKRKTKRKATQAGDAAKQLLVADAAKAEIDAALRELTRTGAGETPQPQNESAGQGAFSGVETGKDTGAANGAGEAGVITSGAPDGGKAEASPAPGARKTSRFSARV